MYLTNFLNHLNKVLTHKRYVAKYCFMCGLYCQGILHDMSKFSLVEFFEGVRYYQGDSSPINACKKDKDYSNAWFHHRGRNKHHWEYWVDDFQKGMIPKKMPFKYILEMFCDFLGAGEAYNGKNFTMDAEYDWWTDKRKKAVLHPNALITMDHLFNSAKYNGIKETLTNKEYINKLKKEYEAY